MRRTVVLTVLLLALPAWAGCFGAVTQDPPAVDDPGTAPAGAVAYDGRGNVRALPPGAPMSFALRDPQHAGAEPTVGVTSSGAIFVISDTLVLRSRDLGATWEDVSPPVNWPGDVAGSLDPYLWVDTDTDRVFASHLYVGCNYLAFSDDEGASWISNPVACGTPVNDHQTIATGRPTQSTLPTLPTYENVVYYGYNGLAYTGVARSMDGGLTFSPATIAIDASNCGGLNGHIKTAPDGTVYVPAAGCDEPVVAVSRDAGLTWEQHVIDTAGAGRSAPGEDPSIALDSDGSAYLVWVGADALMYASVSMDAGATWTQGHRVSPPAITSTLFPASTAGAPGRVAFAYYATTADTTEWGSPYSAAATDDTRWHLFVTYSLDALRGADATWITVQLTPANDAIQVGSIWNGGGGNPDRNLLDFFDMTLDPEGRVIISYTDGCRACETPDTSRERDTMIAVLADGPRLR